MIPVLHPYPETASLLSGDLGRGVGEDDWGICSNHWPGLLRSGWPGLVRNHWQGLVQNHWPGLVRNRWPTLLQNHWPGLVRNSHKIWAIFRFDAPCSRSCKMCRICNIEMGFLAMAPCFSARYFLLQIRFLGGADWAGIFKWRSLLRNGWRNLVRNEWRNLVRNG